MQRISFFLFLFLLVSSCSKTSQVTRNNFQQREFSERIDPHPETTKKLLNEISEKLNAIDSSCETKGTLIPACEKVSIKIPDKNKIESDKNKGIRVLIISDSGMKFAAHGRFRNKILARIHENENEDDNKVKNGDFIEDTESISMPMIAKDILYSLLPQKYDHIPSELLNPVQNLFNKKIDEKSLGINNQKESIYIFNFLANTSPYSQFVLIETEDKALNNICKKNINTLDKVEELFKRQADQILDLIEENKINFISYTKSWRPDRLKTNCLNQSSDMILKIIKLKYNIFIKEITDKSDVIFVQANEDSSYPYEKNDPNFYSSCQENSKRLRIGNYKDLTHSVLSNEMRNAIKYDNLLSEENHNTQNCTDLYVNFSIEKEKPSRYTMGSTQFSSHNVGTSVPNGMEINSSYATPVALSYLLYLKTKDRSLTNEKLLENIRNRKGSGFLMIDPYFNKELPYDEVYYKNILKE